MGGHEDLVTAQSAAPPLDVWVLSDRVDKGGQLLTNFFFYRNAGHWSTMQRFPNTLASQVAEVIPQAGGREGGTSAG